MDNPQPFHIEIVAKLPEADLKVVNEILRCYNQTINPKFWEKLDNPNYQSESLNIVVRGKDLEVIGGLLAETSMSWLKIQIMSISEDHRRMGLGTLLLNKAEAEARDRGCTYSYVDTMDYQASDFYRRQNYEEVGVIPDWDSHGHTKFFFVKKF